MQERELSMQGLFTPGALLRRALIVGGIITATILWQLAFGAHLPDIAFHVHAPHIRLLAEASPAIQIHIAGALLAILVGTILLTCAKGTAWHKRLGWAWVASMSMVAGTSFFIHTLRTGQWSFLHLLSGWVLLALPFAVIAIRRGNVRAHRRTMTGMFIGGLIIAGLFTFAPGRLMYGIFFG